MSPRLNLIHAHISSCVVPLYIPTRKGHRPPGRKCILRQHWHAISDSSRSNCNLLSIVLPKQILHGDQTLRYGPLYTVREIRLSLAHALSLSVALPLISSKATSKDKETLRVSCDAD